MKNLKKALSIILSLAMVMLMAVPSFAAEKAITAPASAYAAYDRAAVADGAVADLSYDQIASLILDWLDRKIAAASDEFKNFNVEISEGLTVPVSIEVNGIDDVLKYKDNLTTLGGDFAKLDTTNLPASREGGDVNFIFSMLQFMADNAQYFGKVFCWEEGQTFDFGKVGEYILTLEDGNAIKAFYNDYLIGNDIQTKFVSEIAREMGYTVKEGETFDDVINNGILGWFTNLCKTNGIISDAMAANMLANYNLRTTDIYTLIKTFVADLQADNDVKIDTYYTYFLDNVVRTMLKTMFGYAPTVGAAVTDTAIVDEFKGVYKDLAKLYELSKGTVDYQAADGKYYRFTINASDVTAVNAIEWGESFINLDPPTVTISDNGTFSATYKPSNTDPNAYMPKIYADAKYQEYLTDEALKELVTFGAVPEEYASIITGEGTALKDAFNFKVAQGEKTIEEMSVTFEQIETAINAALAKKIPDIQTQVDNAVAAAISGASSFIPGINGSAKINSITVAMSYVGYKTDDEFVVQVSVVPAYDIAYEGNVWTLASAIGFTKEKIEADYIQPVINELITNPVATVVVDNLSGTVEGLDDVNALLNFVNTDFDVDYSVVDFAANYDAYNGAIGQMNRVLCSLLKMLLSDEGYASLALTAGGNENLTDNIQKLCDKVDGMFKAVKQFMSEEDFAGFADSLGISNAFISDHGFNASMVYNLDFSSVENLYVCAIRLGCDLFDNGTGLLHDIHEIVENLDTLDAMAIGVMNYAMPKAIETAKANLNGFDYTYTAADVNGNAKDEIMGKLVDIAYAASVWGVDFLNSTVNSAVAKICDTVGIEAPVVAFELGVDKQATWEATLTALVDRVLELTNGIIICVGGIDANAPVFDKISTVANAILPLGSMFSNCAGNGFTCDLGTILNTYIFDEALNGNFDNFLRLFETEVKTDDVAADKPVTFALIKASEHIVDSIFPDTVQYELYADYTPVAGVQEYFTSSANDAVIAANNMRSINGRKANLVPAAFDLMREAGILPYFAKCDHVAGYDDVEEVASTCQVKGHSAYKVCKECGAKVGYTEYEFAPHDFSVKGNTVDPTCTEKGYTVYKCSYCDATENRDETAALGHNYGEWTITKEASCNAAGSREKVCSRCGDKVTEVIPQLTHNWDGGKQTKAPTCTEKGVKTYTCSACGATRTEEIAALGHSYGEWTTVKEPTCKEAGAREKVCTVCGDKVTEEIAATGHTDSDKDNTCDVCGETISTSFWAKIVAFFNRIINWFRNLFK